MLILLLTFFTRPKPIFAFHHFGIYFVFLEETTATSNNAPIKSNLISMRPGNNTVAERTFIVQKHNVLREKPELRKLLSNFNYISLCLSHTVQGKYLYDENKTKSEINL